MKYWRTTGWDIGEGQPVQVAFPVSALFEEENGWNVPNCKLHHEKCLPRLSPGEAFSTTIRIMVVRAW